MNLKSDVHTLRHSDFINVVSQSLFSATLHSTQKSLLTVHSQKLDVKAIKCYCKKSFFQT